MNRPEQAQGNLVRPGRMTKLARATIALLAAMGLLVGGLASAQELNVTLDQNIAVIDPTANWLYDLTSNQFVPLVRYDFATGEVTPGGAESWSVSEDGTTYTFTIRDGWNWSDGTPVTAGDYEYAFKRIADPATAAPMAYRIYVIEGAQAVNQGESSDLSTIGVTAIDDRTLEIKLTAPAAWFLSSLASIGHAVPQWTIEEFGAAWTNPENVVVNGPYRLTRLDEGDVAVLEANPSYYDADKVAIQRVNLFDVSQESTALALYEDGLLHTVSVPATDLDRIMNDPELSQQYYNAPGTVLYYYDFNALREPFDDVLVRQAFAAATDKQAIVDFVTRGGEIVANTITPPGSFGHVPNDAGIGIPFDPERAQELLAEAGHAGGAGIPTITLAFNASETHSRIAQAIQQMWQQTLGVQVELQSVEGATYSQTAADGAYNVWRMGWGMDYPDANNVHAELFTTAVGAAALYHNPEYDRLIAEAAVEQDNDRRAELYREAERLLVQEDAVVMPIYWSADNLLISPELNRPETPSYNRDFWTWSFN